MMVMIALSGGNSLCCRACGLAIFNKGYEKMHETAPQSGRLRFIGTDEAWTASVAQACRS